MERILRFFSAIALFAAFSAVSPSVFAADWKLVDSDEKTAYYVDAETAGKNPVSGWVKVEYKDKSDAQKQASELKKLISDIDWSDLSYICDKVEYRKNGDSVELQRLCTIFYDSKNNMIYVSNYPTTWEKVEPGTVGHAMYNALEKM